MSLLRKTLLYLMLVAVPVALGGIWLFDALINQVIRYEVDEQLSSDLAYVQQQLQSARTPLNRTQTLLDNPHIVRLPNGRFVVPTFSDTVEFDRRENEPVPVRRLTATTPVRGQTYLVVVKQPMGEFAEIARMLSVGIIGAFLLLLSVLTLLNSWVSRRLWQPFYQLIDQLRAYRLNDRAPAQFGRSRIAEFDQLSVALNDMSLTLHQQFTTQKEFTDHAAHEMQTPLAVVTTHLDQLLATEPLTEEQVYLVDQAQGWVRRLVQLNKSLLLLTKIENQQFSDQQLVNLSELVERLHRHFTDYADHRGVTVAIQIKPAVTQWMNPHLADMLFSNLIKNALTHGLPNTFARISLSPTAFVITNVGPPLPFPPEQLFDRFVKNPARQESTGLGLALVKQIADRYRMGADYAYDERGRLHTFTIQFPTR
ncbi:histidine kinase (plasmid) [Fibrella aestuarina BUZ 2]|uniref:histidine kinase n=1 Tax=Fibrella aestuarina BUZ 2 TaxID=1166018 RepID=I0KHN4_9BACT|nr:HAMP domain-containing sensor histidine kinase [Fibrella aestuarina]CCH03637.1 histidine kinase [Fibrella aestuarina BUZ 2]